MLPLLQASYYAIFKSVYKSRNKSVINLKIEILFIMSKGTGRANWREINTLSTKCLAYHFSPISTFTILPLCFQNSLSSLKKETYEHLI